MGVMYIQNKLEENFYICSKMVLHCVYFGSILEITTSETKQYLCVKVIYSQVQEHYFGREKIWSCIRIHSDSWESDNGLTD